MRTNPNIAIAIMFGRGRFQNGVLLHPPNPVNPDNESELIAYRNLVWYVFFLLSSHHGTQSPRRNTIEKANEHAPAHSKIFKEMILVTSPDKPVELTAKGTPRRQVALNAYAREIEDLYEKVKDELIVSAKTLRDAKQNMIVMHPLPRNMELAKEVDDDPRAAYFRQVSSLSLRGDVDLY